MEHATPDTHDPPPITDYQAGLAKALESLPTDPDAAQRSQSLEPLAQEIAATNLSAAVGFRNEQGSFELEKASAMLEFAYEAARAEPIAALNLAMELPASDARDDLLAHAANQWAFRAPVAAAEWARQIVDDALRERLLAGIATEWGETDPRAAAGLALESLSSGKPQDDALVGIVLRWAQKEPEVAADWVTEFPPGTLRDTALEELVKLWTDQDLEAAGDWLNRLRPGSVRQVAVAAYVGKLAPQFPEIAAEWAHELRTLPSP
jgi:hypothetical protein